MTTALVVLGFVLAVVSGVRGTWSPCGLSMLSSLTPLAEAGRGHRYRPAAAWFMIGATAGGACLGGAMAAAGWLVSLCHLGAGVACAAVAGGGLVALVSDSEVLPWSLPIHRRQVNERWLDHYRTWVYGAGFGWQIGTGLATYITTSAIYLMIVLAVVSGRPAATVGFGVAFGAVRGSGVLICRRVRSPADLIELHRRVEALRPTAERCVLAAELAVVITMSTLTGLVPLWLGLSAGLAAVPIFVRRPAPIRANELSQDLLS